MDANRYPRLAKELFPDYELSTLPEDHLLYTAYFPRSKWRSKPRVEAVIIGPSYAPLWLSRKMLNPSSAASAATIQNRMVIFSSAHPRSSK